MEPGSCLDLVVLLDGASIVGSRFPFAFLITCDVPHGRKSKSIWQTAELAPIGGTTRAWI